MSEKDFIDEIDRLKRKIRKLKRQVKDAKCQRDAAYYELIDLSTKVISTGVARIT